MATINRFNVLRLALFCGLLGAFIAVIMDFILLVVYLINFSSFNFLTLIGLGFGMSLLVILLSYTIIGFISGLLFGALTNLALKILKGIELDIDLTETQTPLKKEKPIKTKTEKPTTSKISPSASKTEPSTNSKQAVSSHPRKSTLDSTPISQMTNPKTASRKTSGTA